MFNIHTTRRRGGRGIASPWRLFPVVLAGLFLAAGSAAAQTELVTNGSFESNLDSFNDVPGWTGDPGPCGYTARIGGADFRPAATAGAQVLELATGSSTITCTVYQDIAIPAGATGDLTYAIGVNATAASASTLKFEIVPTVGPLVTVYSWMGTSPAETLAARTPVSIAPYAGQTIRLRVTHDHVSQYFNSFLDDVSVRVTVAAPPAPVPTLGEWAMILLGFVLAAGAALYLQRRRLAA